MEIEWKTLSKGRDLKDAALLKGLAALGKANQDPAARLKALDDIEKQSEQLRKSARNDKEVKAFLDDMAKAMERQCRQARQDEKAAEAESEEAVPLRAARKRSFRAHGQGWESQQCQVE